MRGPDRKALVREREPMTTFTTSTGDRIVYRGHFRYIVVVIGGTRDETTGEWTTSRVWTEKRSDSIETARKCEKAWRSRSWYPVEIIDTTTGERVR